MRKNLWPAKERAAIEDFEDSHFNRKIIAILVRRIQKFPTVPYNEEIRQKREIGWNWIIKSPRIWLG